MTQSLAVADSSFAKDSCSYNFSVEQGKNIYSQELFNPYIFINGEEYKFYHKPGGSNPFLNGSAGIGTIYYGDHSFDDLLLYFDVLKDQLVVSAKMNTLYGDLIKVQKTFIDSFTINYEHSLQTFYHINVKKENGLPNLNGYYEIPYKGKYQLLYYYSSYVYIDEGKEVFNINKDWLIKVDDKYYNINKKRRLLKLFPKHRKAIRKELNSNYLVYYTSLSQSQLIGLIQFVESFK